MKYIEWYYYLFYKFYKVTSTGAIKSLADWYAALGIGALEILSVISFYNYYKLFYDHSFKLQLGTIFFPLIVILVINHWAFFGDKWQEYVERFDQWQPHKNVIGSWIVTIVVLALITNIVVSYYLLSQTTF